MNHSEPRTPKRKGGDISAIFVHAGAGFHSTQNEGLHLKACADAAQTAMAFLRNGGTAVDAVEKAIRVFEDRSITNSGYGSNLTLDGVVECDATIVDHLGRSGAVGAVSQIQNPISLARMVLEHSNQPLSLRRVPPNLLVGQGATDFAFDQGFAVLPHDALVSPSARERWLKWRADLKKVECEDGVEIETITQGNEIDLQYEAAVQMQQRRDHTRAMAAGTIETPEQSPPTPSGSAMDTSSPDSRRPLTRSVADSPHPPGSPEEQPHGSLLGPTPWAKGVLSESRHSDQGAATYAHNQGRDGTASLLEGGNVDDEMTGVDDGINFSRREWHNSGRHDGSSESGSWTDSSDDTDGTIQLPSASPSPPPFAALHTRLPDSPPEGTTEMPIDTPLEHVVDAASLPHPDNLRSHMPSVDITDTRQDIEERADLIIDTVGAIAIDCYGNISAGSSSGGIGMKHRGRTGPAALVGVGTAVVPIDPTDKQKTCVGVVTSGTGEHMATTMAAGVCADRLYSSVRKKNGGGLEVVGEDHCIRGVIEKDFMDHPSVKNSHSVGAIGILAVKKTRDGVYLYFAHNTDSFAVASMHSDEKVPKCTMSRSVGNGIVAQGGRAARYVRRR